jgi:hypothetical protein
VRELVEFARARPIPREVASATPRQFVRRADQHGSLRERAHAHAPSSSPESPLSPISAGRPTRGSCSPPRRAAPDTRQRARRASWGRVRWSRRAFSEARRYGTTPWLSTRTRTQLGVVCGRSRRTSGGHSPRWSCRPGLLISRHGSSSLATARGYADCAGGPRAAAIFAPIRERSSVAQSRTAAPNASVRTDARPRLSL